MKTSEFTKRMKAELNNETNVFNEFELKLYGVQAYGVTYGEEYNVIVKAARRANGRYYFITREGYEIAWSTLPAEKVEKICADMYDQHESDEKAARESYDRLKANGTAHVRAEIMNDVYKLADAEGVAVFVLTSGADEINRLYYVCSLGTTADEGRSIARAAAAADHQDTDTTTPADVISEPTESEPTACKVRAALCRLGVALAGSLASLTPIALVAFVVSFWAPLHVDPAARWYIAAALVVLIALFGPVVKLANVFDDLAYNYEHRAAAC